MKKSGLTCDVTFVKRVTGENMTIEMYTFGTYLKNNPTWHVEDSPWKAMRIVEMIKRNNLHPDSICEIGCGAGEILNQLYLQLPEKIIFHGYEISPQAFDLCQQRQKEERLQYHLGNILQEEITFFDIILAIDVIEHVEDCFDFLRKLRQKGQYKIFHIPLDISVQSVFRGSPIAFLRNKDGHIHYFTKEAALATLRDTGYEIIDYFYTDGVVDLPAKSFMSLLAKQLLKIMYKLNKDMTVRIFGGSSLMVLTN